ncbi:MAG: M56 family metallopeptidase [Leeuwenhoekiella sp.]
MGAYLLQTMLFQLVFLTFYLLLLRRETFFTANRIYLLATAVLSFVLPFAEIELVQQTLPLRLPVSQLPEITIGVTNQGLTPYHYPGTYDETPFWLSLIYLVGFIVALRYLVRKLAEVNRLYRFRQQGDDHIITIPNRFLAFTYLRTIFLGGELLGEDRKQVLAHEEIHYREGHGFDLFAFEILRVVMWFNPLIYIYQHLLAETHEFLADKNAIKKTELKTYANQLLNLAFETQNVSFVNTFFNQSLIKKRIVMLQKQSKNAARFKYLLTVPLIAGMIAVASCSQDEEQYSEKINLEADDQKMSQMIRELESKDDRTAKDDYFLDILHYYIAKNQAARDGTEPPAFPKIPNSIVTQYKSGNANYQPSNVPFSVIDKVPEFPGCDDLETNDAKRKCFSEKIDAIVKENFNSAIGKQLGLSGVNRIYVQFAISENGEITYLKARAPHPELEREAERVINLMPQVTPGKQGGEPVKVLYSLPIVFQVQ